MLDEFRIKQGQRLILIISEDREVQPDFKTEMVVLYMLFERCHTKNRKRSLKYHRVVQGGAKELFPVNKFPPSLLPRNGACHGQPNQPISESSTSIFSTQRHFFCSTLYFRSRIQWDHPVHSVEENTRNKTNTPPSLSLSEFHLPHPSFNRLSNRSPECLFTRPFCRTDCRRLLTFFSPFSFLRSPPT